MSCIIRIHALNTSLNVHEQAIVDTLIALIDIRAGYLFIDHFNNNDIVNMINELL